MTDNKTDLTYRYIPSNIAIGNKLALKIFAGEIRKTDCLSEN
jgi:hypothetical protein